MTDDRAALAQLYGFIADGMAILARLWR